MKETGPDHRVRRPIRVALCLLVFLLPALSGCHAMTYRVGMGGNNIGQKTMQQYYLFFGLVRLNDVDIQREVADYTGYDVEVGFAYHDGFWDTVADFMFSAVFLLPLTITRQAVTVKY